MNRLPKHSTIQTKDKTSSPAVAPGVSSELSAAIDLNRSLNSSFTEEKGKSIPQYSLTPTLSPALVDIIKERTGCDSIRFFKQGGEGISIEITEADGSSKMGKLISSNELHLCARDEDGYTTVPKDEKILSALNHPGLPKYYDTILIPEFGQILSRRENVQGESLQAVHSVEGNFSPERVLETLKSLARILDYIHDPKQHPELPEVIVHRDIKPSNIIVREDGTLCLIDFGIARLSESGIDLSPTTTIRGTVKFMAPEQRLGEGYPSSDIYSLGTTALNLLLGFVPEELKYNHTVQPYRLLETTTIPPKLHEVLQKMLEADPKKRYQNATELLKDLHQPDILESGTQKKASLYRRTINQLLGHHRRYRGRMNEVERLAESGSPKFQEELRTTVENFRYGYEINTSLDRIQELQNTYEKALEARVKQLENNALELVIQGDFDGGFSERKELIELIESEQYKVFEPKMREFNHRFSLRCLERIESTLPHKSDQSEFLNTELEGRKPENFIEGQLNGLKQARRVLDKLEEEGYVQSDSTLMDAIGTCREQITEGWRATESQILAFAKLLGPIPRKEHFFSFCQEVANEAIEIDPSSNLSENLKEFEAQQSQANKHAPFTESDFGKLWKDLERSLQDTVRIYNALGRSNSRLNEVSFSTSAEREKRGLEKGARKIVNRLSRNVANMLSAIDHRYVNIEVQVSLEQDRHNEEHCTVAISSQELKTNTLNYLALIDPGARNCLEALQNGSPSTLMHSQSVLRKLSGERTGYHNLSETEEKLRINSQDGKTLITDHRGSSHLTGAETQAAVKALSQLAKDRPALHLSIHTGEGINRDRLLAKV